MMWRRFPRHLDLPDGENPPLRARFGSLPCHLQPKAAPNADGAGELAAATRWLYPSRQSPEASHPIRRLWPCDCSDYL